MPRTVGHEMCGLAALLAGRIQVAQKLAAGWQSRKSGSAVLIHHRVAEITEKTKWILVFSVISVVTNSIHRSSSGEIASPNRSDFTPMRFISDRYKLHSLRLTSPLLW